MHPRCQQSKLRGDRATLKRINRPFDRVSKWELTLGGTRFGRYRTKAAAVADAKKIPSQDRSLRGDYDSNSLSYSEYVAVSS